MEKTDFASYGNVIVAEALIDIPLAASRKYGHVLVFYECVGVNVKSVSQYGSHILKKGFDGEIGGKMVRTQGCKRDMRIVRVARWFFVVVDSGYTWVPRGKLRSPWSSGSIMLVTKMKDGWTKTNIIRISLEEEKRSRFPRISGGGNFMGFAFTQPEAIRK